MSSRLSGKLLRSLGIAVFLGCAMPAVSFAQQFGTPTAASCLSCAPFCQSHHCPPAFQYCYEGPPRIHFQRGCPRPVCNPCDLPHFGYFDTCWSPWPFPANWTHCPTPPPAAFVTLNNPVMLPAPSAPRMPSVIPQPGSVAPP